jgi:quercetin dioxygenase-like cupin family protein
MAGNRRRPTMSVTPQDDDHRRPHAPPRGGPYLEFDLMRELELLHRESEWQNGQNARTLVKNADFRAVLIALKEGARIPEHQNRGRISLQTLLGHVLVRADGRTFDLPNGSLLVLDPDLRHDVEATKDSAFLLTIAWPGGEGG